ncbi:MAG: hypothetical protein HPY52_06860 [Firmicutes bacterium]|nr:hypothetical protein [Bacillota bacterium]
MLERRRLMLMDPIFILILIAIAFPLFSTGAPALAAGTTGAISGTEGSNSSQDQPAATAVDLEKLHNSLQDYLQNGDPTFAWQKIDEIPVDTQGKFYLLSLTSQSWHDIVWTHQVGFYVPKTLLNPHLAMVYITGSDDLSTGQNEIIPLALTVSDVIQAPVAILNNVPNQPLFGGLTEDALIAHTFVQFLETGDSTWPALLPMVKSAVRAMDAIQAFAKQDLGLEIDSFIVTGASKRGWTSWLTGAVDPRVKGIIPMSYNNLNLAEQMKLQLEQFGTYSASINDYTRLGLTDLAGGEEGQLLMAIVDPYSFRDQLDIPKLIVVGTNDSYWPVDALNVYLKDLPGPTYQLFLPNAGHGLGDYDDLLTTMGAFYLHVSGLIRLPNINWQFSSRPDGAAELHVDVSPGTAVDEVQFWAAFSDTRDFRQAVWTQVGAYEKAPCAHQVAPSPGDEGAKNVAILAQVILNFFGRKVTFSTPVFVAHPVDGGD